MVSQQPEVVFSIRVLFKHQTLFFELFIENYWSRIKCGTVVYLSNPRSDTLIAQLVEQETGNLRLLVQTTSEALVHGPPIHPVVK